MFNPIVIAIRFIAGIPVLVFYVWVVRIWWKEADKALSQGVALVFLTIFFAVPFYFVWRRKRAWPSNPIVGSENAKVG